MIILELQLFLSSQTSVDSYMAVALNNGPGMIPRLWWRCVKYWHPGPKSHLVIYFRFMCQPFLVTFLQKWRKPFHLSWTFATLPVVPVWTVRHLRPSTLPLPIFTDFGKCSVQQVFSQMASHSHGNTPSHTTATSSRSLGPQEGFALQSWSLNTSQPSKNPGVAPIVTKPLAKC